jgi:hypothetical protein
MVHTLAKCEWIKKSMPLCLIRGLGVTTMRQPNHAGGPAMAINTVADVTPMKRVAAACLVGSTVEFYDFLIYGTAAALVFPTVFFPHLGPATATIASMGTFAAAFLSRPLGVLVFGHFGDRLGRKKTLVATLLVMALSTVSVGLVPSTAAIGVAARLAPTVSDQRNIHRYRPVCPTQHRRDPSRQPQHQELLRCQQDLAVGRGAPGYCPRRGFSRYGWRGPPAPAVRSRHPGPVGGSRR